MDKSHRLPQNIHGMIGVKNFSIGTVDNDQQQYREDNLENYPQIKKFISKILGQENLLKIILGWTKVQLSQRLIKPRHRRYLRFK